MNVSREKAMQWTAQGAIVVLVIVAAIAAIEFMKANDLEATLAQMQASSEKANQDSGMARKKLQDELKAASAKAADLEQKQRYYESMKALLGKVEPQVVTALENSAKAGKPDMRAAALNGVGLIGQLTHGPAHEPALAALNRALTLDKNNCVAGLAINMSGVNKVEVNPDCQSILPQPPAAEAPKPAPAAGDAAKAPTPADAGKAPAGEAGKAPVPAAKS